MSAPGNSDPNKTEYSSLVPAVEQASRILVALAQATSGKMTLTEVCKAVGIHKSKGYSILNTLQNFAFVHRSPDTKAYSLGSGLLFLSARVLNNLDYREAAAPLLRKLSHEMNSTAFLGLISGSHLFVVAKDEGIQNIGVTIKLGHRFPLAWGAHGKSIMAYLPASKRKEILGSSKVYFHGSASRFDLDRLEQELVRCRETGFATDMSEMKGGVQAVAAAVFGPGGKLIGSLAVVGTFPREITNEYGQEVARAAKEFSGLVGGDSYLSTFKE
ncbi:MAG TPA: IclR family transcriptional regulator [Desulfomonilaceae bacterium]|nr:IclR family transcriptional regulator [Desulfomonilaceae bacterium]